MFKFNLGDQLRDKITGFTGIATGRTEWLNGCIRYALQSEKLKDGAVQSSEHFDEEQLDLVLAGKVIVAGRMMAGDGKESKGRRRPGGPRDDKAMARRDMTG